MHTARSCSRPGGVSTPPRTRHPQDQAPPPPRTRHPPPRTEFLTHVSENITLLQTSFAGGNYLNGCSHGATAILSSQQMGCTGCQCQCSHDAIVTWTLNPIEPISCEKYIAVANLPCEQPLIFVHTLYRWL